RRAGRGRAGEIVGLGSRLACGDLAQTCGRFEAGATIVIGTFPKTYLELWQRNTVPRDATQPFAMLPVDQARLDEIPSAQGGVQMAIVTRNSIRVEQADDGLGLLPPFLVGVRQPGRAAFIEKRAIGIDTFGE